ncbi:MAG: PAS domain-containing protein [Candidatus Protistobacter heckmanni]|nr:PAS domain-containing protein [Candidatus Protistobacter heckmanni]
MLILLALAGLSIAGLGTMTHRRIVQTNLARQNAKLSESRLRSAMVSLVEGIIVHDAEGTIIEWNDAALKILDLSHDQATGLATRERNLKMIYEDGPAARSQRTSIRP